MYVSDIEVELFTSNTFKPDFSFITISATASTLLKLKDASYITFCLLISSSLVPITAFSYSNCVEGEASIPPGKSCCASFPTSVPRLNIAFCISES